MMICEWRIVDRLESEIRPGSRHRVARRVAGDGRDRRGGHVHEVHGAARAVPLGGVARHDVAGIRVEADAHAAPGRAVPNDVVFVYAVARRGRMNPVERVRRATVLEDFAVGVDQDAVALVAVGHAAADDRAGVDDEAAQRIPPRRAARDHAAAIGLDPIAGIVIRGALRQARVLTKVEAGAGIAGDAGAAIAHGDAALQHTGMAERESRFRVAGRRAAVERYAVPGCVESVRAISVRTAIKDHTGGAKIKAVRAIAGCHTVEQRAVRSDDKAMGSTPGATGDHAITHRAVRAHADPCARLCRHPHLLHDRTCAGQKTDAGSGDSPINRKFFEPHLRDIAQVHHARSRPAREPAVADRHVGQRAGRSDRAGRRGSADQREAVKVEGDVARDDHDARRAAQVPGEVIGAARTDRKRQRRNRRPFFHLRVDQVELGAELIEREHGGSGRSRRSEQPLSE